MVEIESLIVSCASLCFASCESLTISEPHNLADLVNLITTDGALIRPVRSSLDAHSARILSCRNDDNFLTSLNLAKPLVLSNLLPYFQYERSRVIYGSPYRKGPKTRGQHPPLESASLFAMALWYLKTNSTKYTHCLNISVYS